MLRAHAIVVTAIGTAVLLASCGGSESADTLPQVQQRALPLELGALNDLCTKLPEEWRTRTYQAMRRSALRQADALIRALRAHPDAKVRVHFQDADSGLTVRETMSVRALAREQLHLYDGARYCSRPDAATPPPAAREGLTRIRAIRALVGQPRPDRPAPN